MQDGGVGVGGEVGQKEGRQKYKAPLRARVANDLIPLSAPTLFFLLFPLFRPPPLYHSLFRIERALPPRSSSTRSLILSHPGHLISPALPPLQLSLRA